MQHRQGGAGASGLHAAVSQPRLVSSEALYRHALCMPMQLPYSKCLSVGRCDLDFGRDDDGQVRGTAATPMAVARLRSLSVGRASPAVSVPQVGRRRDHLDATAS
jgi:hypothetical protein